MREPWPSRPPRAWAASDWAADARGACSTSGRRPLREHPQTFPGPPRGASPSASQSTGRGQPGTRPVHSPAGSGRGLWPVLPVPTVTPFARLHCLLPAWDTDPVSPSPVRSPHECLPTRSLFKILSCFPVTRVEVVNWNV